MPQAVNMYNVQLRRLSATVCTVEHVGVIRKEGERTTEEAIALEFSTTVSLEQSSV